MPKKTKKQLQNAAPKNLMVAAANKLNCLGAILIVIICMIGRLIYHQPEIFAISYGYQA